MLRRLFASPARRAAGPRFVRPRLERLEEREVLDAAAIQTLNYIAYYTYLTEVQTLQAQTAEQKDYGKYQQDLTLLNGGAVGASLAAVKQDIAQLKQDAGTLQKLADTYFQENYYFLLNLAGGVGSAFTAADQGTVLFDAYYVLGGQSAATSAYQTAATLTAITPPAAPPTPTPPPTPTQLPATPTTASNASPSQLVTLTLNPLDINLLGLEVKTDQIQVTISAQPGQGDLLGNLLSDTANLLNLPAVSTALNNALGGVVSLLNSSSLSVSGVDTTGGSLSTSTSTATTPVLDAYVAPVHLNLLGAVVDTSPIHLSITAHSGQGQVLGNVLTDLANLFNPPLPSQLSLDYINNQLQQLLNQLNTQIPNIGSSTATTTTTTSGSQVLSLTVPPINVNLLGLILKTSAIQVNANAQTGNGNLLGNLTQDLLNTVGATPQSISTLNDNLNALLAKVVGVLNASSLSLPANALSTLAPVLQELAVPNLVNSSGTATTPILNLAIASTDGTTPPVDVNLLGLVVTTSNVQAQLLAQTGDGQVLGNLLYNAANLLNPGGSLNLLTVLNELAL